MIVSTVRPTIAEVSSALAAGYAVELRSDGTARFIGADHAVEIDTLGDRVFDALEYKRPVPEWPTDEVSDTGRHHQSPALGPPAGEAVEPSCHSETEQE